MPFPLVMQATAGTLFERYYLQQQQWKYIWPLATVQGANNPSLAVQQVGERWVIIGEDMCRSWLTEQDLDCWQHIARQQPPTGNTADLYARYWDDQFCTYQDYWAQTKDDPGNVSWHRDFNGEPAFQLLLPIDAALAVIDDLRQLLTNVDSLRPYRAATANNNLPSLLLRPRASAKQSPDQ